MYVNVCWSLEPTKTTAAPEPPAATASGDVARVVVLPCLIDARRRWLFSCGLRRHRSSTGRPPPSKSLAGRIDVASALLDVASALRGGSMANRANAEERAMRLAAALDLLARELGYDAGFGPGTKPSPSSRAQGKWGAK